METLTLSGLVDLSGVSGNFGAHDQIGARAMADRIAVPDEGRLLQAGAPLDQQECPANRFAAARAAHDEFPGCDG